MEPYNYSLPQTAQRPDAFGQGFVQGQALKQQDQERVQQQQMLDAFGQISQNPTVANISSAMGRFPQLSEKFKPLLDSATAQQKQNHIRQASDIFMMLGSGKREMAIKTLQEHADAARNAGDEGAARSAEVMKNLIESSETGESGDKHVMALSGMYLAAAMGPEEFMKTYEGLLKMPSTMSEAEAKAQEGPGHRAEGGHGGEVRGVGRGPGPAEEGLGHRRYSERHRSEETERQDRRPERPDIQGRPTNSSARSWACRCRRQSKSGMRRSAARWRRSHRSGGASTTCSPRSRWLWTHPRTFSMRRWVLSRGRSQRSLLGQRT